MSDLKVHVKPLGTYTEDDVRSWAGTGSAPRAFEDMLHAAMRAQFLLAAIGSSLGAAVEKGLADTEVAMSLALASRAAGNALQLEAKRATLRDYASAGSWSIVGAMVRAALAHDERRLGLARAEAGTSLRARS